MFDLKRFLRNFIPGWSDNNNQTDTNLFKTVESIIPPKTKFLFGKYISLSIDNNSIQLAVSFHFGPKIKLIDVTKIYLSKSLDTEEKKISFISSNVNDYLNQHGSWFPRVSLTISGQATALRNFIMPTLSKKDLKAAIRFERKNQVPFPDENCIHDFRINSEIKNGKRTKYRISLFASTHSNIINQIKRLAFGGENLNLWKIYHAQDSIGLMLRHLRGYRPDKKYTLLNQSRGFTEVSFYKGSQIQFYHNSEISTAVQGGMIYTTKFEFYAETIEDQLRISFDYYNGQTNESPSNEILVYGDLSYSDDLLEILENNSNFEFRKFPIYELSFLSKKENEFDESLSASLAVVASTTCNARSINLLPDNIAQKRKKYVQTIYSKIALGTTILLIAFSWFSIDKSLQITQDQLKSTNYSVDMFKNSEAYHTYNNLKKQILNNQTYLEKIKKEPAYLSHNLKELSNLTPRQIKLIYFDFNSNELDKNILLQGVVKSTKIPPEIILAEYTETLASSPFFDNVHIIKHVKNIEREQFFIEFVIKMRGGA